MTVNKSKKGEINKALRKGQDLLSSGNFIDAKDIFEELYEKEPDNKEVQNFLGMVLFKLGLHKEAMDLYKTLLKKAPNFPSLHLNLGTIYYKEGLIDLAVEEFEKTIEFDKKNTRALNYLGLIYMANGNYEKALEKFTLSGSKKMIKEINEKLKESLKSVEEGVEENTDKKGELGSLKVKEALVDTDAKFDSALAEESKVHSIKEVAEDLRRSVFKATSDKCFIETYRNLVKLNITDEVYAKLSCLESFSGGLVFKGAHKIIQKKKTSEMLGSPEDPILNVFGKGSIILCIGSASITPFTLNNEEFFVNEKHLLAFEKSVSYENASMSFTEGFELIKLSGSGTVLLIAENKPFTQNVDDDNPLAIKLEYLMGWLGKLKSHIVKGKESLFKRREDSKWVTFKGKGYIFCLVKDESK